MTVSRKFLVGLGVLVGLLLLVIGNIGGGHHNIVLAGDFFFAISLIWGGLAAEDNIALKVTMLAIGGLFVIAAFAGSPLNLASLLRGG